MSLATLVNNKVHTEVRQQTKERLTGSMPFVCGAKIGIKNEGSQQLFAKNPYEEMQLQLRGSAKFSRK